MVHYAKYVQKNEYDVPYTDFLPLLINLEKFLPPVPPSICYENLGCFENTNSFKCLEGALPDVNERSYHLRMVFEVIFMIRCSINYAFDNLKTFFREYDEGKNSYQLIFPTFNEREPSLSEQYHQVDGINAYWKDVSRLVLIVHGMNSDSNDDDVRGIEYDFPGTKTVYLEYEKVCH